MCGAARRLIIRGTVMGRIPPRQKAAIDVIDRLYFNQILVFCVYGESERDWLARIIGAVSNAVRETGAASLQAECLKHGVLCLMEILLSEDLDKLNTTSFVHVKRPKGLSNQDVRRLNEHTRSYFLAYVIAVLQKVHGDSMAHAPLIAEELAEAFRRAPSTVRYRLAERCLAYEFQQAPLDCLSWMAKTGVILSAKYPPEWIEELPAEAVLARIGLLCEFDMIRNHVGTAAKTPNIAHVALDTASKLSQDTIRTLLRQEYRIEEQKRLDSFRNTVLFFNTRMLRDAIYVREFFAAISRFCTRFRIWHGTLASWLGALGAVLVEIEKSIGPAGRPIYIEIDNSGTITDDVAISLRRRGFTILGRTLYEHHRSFSGKTLRQVQVYFEVLDTHKVAINPHLEDLFYYGIITNTVDSAE